MELLSLFAEKFVANVLTNVLGSVWIELILLKLKTENWKHCSKIIFKCVNSVVGPIFNEKIDKKWNLWVHEQYTDALFTKDGSKVVATVHIPYMNSTACWGKGVEKKKCRIVKRSKRRSKHTLNIRVYDKQQHQW